MADSTNSLTGVSSGIDTNALINAILAMKGGNVARLKARKELNTKKTETLTAMRTSLTTLALSLSALQDKFNNRTVVSSDANNTYATATGTGAAAGNYDLTVTTVATKGRISSTLDVNGLTTNLAVASPTDSATSPVFTTGTPATFAVRGTDGVIKTITLDDSSNTLNGLRDKINASGAGVTASVVNMGKGPKPYQLVLTAKETGTGSTLGVVTIADVTNMLPDGSAGASANNLGIDAGGSLDAFSQSLTGGLTSTASGATATDATFTLNGIALTRTTNVVKDAADGMVFTLKQGGQVGVTTLTVTPDKTGATLALQDFITKYNAFLKEYKASSTAGRNPDGSIKLAPLSEDNPTRAMIASLKATFTGATSGLPLESAYQNMASLGITTQADGTLYLNTNTFQTAMTNDLAAVQRLFNFSGSSTSSSVSLKDGGTKAPTGRVDFEITKINGALWGTLTRNGVTSDPIAVTDGTLIGTGDFDGLSLNVIDVGAGYLTLSRGAGQAAKDILSAYTGVTGGITSTLNSITIQNKNLTDQIAQGQSRLDREREILKKKFAKMEATLGQMRYAAGGLSGA